MSDDIHWLSAAELSAAYREQTLSPVEVTEFLLGRIDALDAEINSFCLIDAGRTMAMAEASERRWQEGEPLSPLDGVPVGVKDLLITKDWPTLRGSLTVDKNQTWDADAPTVARLREAGAVLIGKTTTPEFGWKGSCDSPLTGVTRNPGIGTPRPAARRAVPARPSRRAFVRSRSAPMAAARSASRPRSPEPSV